MVKVRKSDPKLCKDTSSIKLTRLTEEQVQNSASAPRTRAYAEVVKTPPPVVRSRPLEEARSATLIGLPMPTVNQCTRPPPRVAGSDPPCYRDMAATTADKPLAGCSANIRPSELRV